MDSARHTRPGAGVLAMTVAILAVGTLLYWVVDGRPRSPAAFRELIAESGLVVEWSNNGPRGGNGIVATDCGEQEVSINELGGEFWVEWENQRAPITPGVVDQILRCDGGPGQDTSVPSEMDLGAYQNATTVR